MANLLTILIVLVLFLQQCSGHSNDIENVVKQLDDYCEEKGDRKGSAAVVHANIEQIVLEEITEINAGIYKTALQLKSSTKTVSKFMTQMKNLYSDMRRELGKSERQINNLMKTSGWFEAENGVMYKLFKKKITFINAREECENIGAELADLLDHNTRREVFEAVVRPYATRTWVESLGGDPCGWLETDGSINDHLCDAAKFYYLCSI